MPRSPLPLQVARLPRRGNRIASVILATLIAASATACDSRRTTVSSTSQTTEPVTVQPSPSPAASPSPIALSEIPKPVPPSKPLTPPSEIPPSKPAAPPAPQPDTSAVQPDGVAVNPDSPLPIPDGVRLGDVKYRTSATAADAALEAAIVEIMAGGSGDKSMLGSMRYAYDRVDLNDDGAPEALVYLMGSYTCGSGGCTMLILESTGQSYEMVSRMTLVNPPVVIANEKTAGWKDLIIYVQGGGATPHYARLQFDGSRYPSNPSIVPAVSSDVPLSGTAILTEKMTPDSGIQVKL